MYTTRRAHHANTSSSAHHHKPPTFQRRAPPPTTRKNTKSMFYCLDKCQSVLLAMSLLFNVLLFYWVADRYTYSKPSDLVCNTLSNDPNSPCNPQYWQKIIELNPSIKHQLLQTVHHLNQNNRVNQDHPLRGRVKQKYTSNGNQMDTDNEALDGEVGGTGNSKQSDRSQLQISTVSAPSYDHMSSIADANKRELSWISPFARKLSGDVDYRANPNLFITDSERDIWFNNRFFVFEREKVAFCVMEKNSCSMFKQIFKRVRGKKDYLSTDYTKIHYLPYRGLEDISFLKMDKLNRVMNDDEFYFAAFVREPLERLVSGYIDKCDKKRGVNLCDYARWSPLFEPEYGEWGQRRATFTPRFDIWADGLFHCPCWPETDWHFAPQFNFCNLFQYVDKYDIFRFENTTHRKTWMERAGFWDKYGKSGWKSGGDDGVSIVDFGPQKHSSTGASNDGDKYIKVYKDVDPVVFASIVDHYRNDYILFGIQMAEWVCHDEMTQVVSDPNVKRALRTLPRTSRPPCDNHRWLWERE